MTDPHRFEERYRTGDTPWEHTTADSNLREIVTGRPIPACKALDVGCGTGTDAIWLAQQGFDVATHCDVSPTAVEEARRRAKKAGVECSFAVLDFLAEDMPDMSFRFVFDRGCLHSCETIEKRKEFARRVHDCLEDGGLWLNLSGNADGPPREIGPPRLSAEELVSIVEPYFEIISLEAGHFGSEQTKPPESWICLSRKR